MKLPKFIFQKVKTHNTSLGDNEAFPPENEYPFDYFILKKRYNDIMSSSSKEFSDLDEQKLLNKLSKLLNRCKKIEEPFHDVLIKTCENIVTKLFNIPNDTIVFDLKIVGKVTPEKSFRIMPESHTQNEFTFDSLTDMNNFNTVILKRRFINSLIQGISYKYSSTHFFANEIYQINKELISLYDDIRKINDILLFIKEEKITDKNHMQGACVEVELGSKGEKTLIKAQGITFLHLLTETIRGLFELFASHGLPEDNKKAINIIKHSDFLLAEPWDLRFGVELWEMIGGKIKETEILPFYFTRLCELPVSKFNNKVKEILANTKLGNKLQLELYHKAKKEFDLNKISSNIKIKNLEKNIIEDDVMTVDDLNNDDLDNQDFLLSIVKTCDFNDIDFIEQDFNDYQSQLIVTIEDIELPISVVNLKVEPRSINGDILYQLHIFIDPMFQHCGLGYKIYKQFINLFGNIYSSNGRRLNDQEIISILKKLNKENDIVVFKIYNSKGINLGYEAKKIN